LALVDVRLVGVGIEICGCEEEDMAALAEEVVLVGVCEIGEWVKLFLVGFKGNPGVGKRGRR
jgi:hypothetical protein